MRSHCPVYQQERVADGPLRPFCSIRYYDRIQPWRHYVRRSVSSSVKFELISHCLQVPVKQDYSDLYNTLAFFDGGLGPDRPGHHDLLAEKIATQGREWAEQFWRTEDMTSCEFGTLSLSRRVADHSLPLRPFPIAVGVCQTVRPESKVVKRVVDAD